ncbi:MAG: PH domain-containing protein [Candidatus Nanopelagicales bacterium]
MTRTVDEAFAPPGEPWVHVSPKLVTARRISLGLAYVLVLAGLIALIVVPGVPAWVPAVVAGVAFAVFVWAWWLIGRRVRSYGYVERTDDLMVTSGILFRRLVIVPYGRMQLVDLKAGPIDRSLGVATVQLHTAAATTDATIPGLPPDAAAALRDRLAARGEQRSAGL